jgi:hypothetical protein
LRCRRAGSQAPGIRRAGEKLPDTGRTFDKVGKQSWKSW